MILLKPVWEIPSFLFASLWLCSSHHVLGLRYCYDLKDATNCGQCAGTRQCGQERVSLSPDPKPSISLLLRLTGLLLASPWEGQGGGWEQGGKFAHTFQAAFGAFHSPHSHTGDCECAARAEACFSSPLDGASVIACVSGLMVSSLVYLGSRPVLWLSSTIGYRERERKGWWPQGDCERAPQTCAVLLLSLRSSAHIVDVRSAPSKQEQQREEEASQFKSAITLLTLIEWLWNQMCKWRQSWLLRPPPLPFPVPGLSPKFAKINFSLWIGHKTKHEKIKY